MYFISRRYKYDKKCAYYSYCNYIGYEYKGDFIQNTTVEEFYQFLWKQNHPCIVIEKPIFMSLFIQHLPKTSMFLVENNHIYVIQYNEPNQYIVMDSNYDKIDYITNTDLKQHAMRSTYIVLIITPWLYNYLKLHIQTHKHKNNYYKQKYTHIQDILDIYKQNYH